MIGDRKRLGDLGFGSDVKNALQQRTELAKTGTGPIGAGSL